MRLYPLDGTQAITDGGESYEAGRDGGFDLPEEFGTRLNRFPNWENDIERQERLMAEEMDRRRDPKTLLEAVEKLVRAGEITLPAATPEPPAPAVKAEPEPAEPARQAPRRTTAKPAK